MELLLTEDLVLKDVEGDDRNTILSIIAKNIIEQGYARKSFEKAIIAREKTFSTGLETTEYGVAIPHTDAEHVNTPCISIAILKNPIDFVIMGEVDKIIPVKVVFMLAVTEPHAQLKLLQNLMMILQDKEVLKRLIDGRDKGAIKQIISNKLGLSN